LLVGKKGKHHMIPPLAIDFQIFPQETFPLEPGVFEKPDAFEVFRIYPFKIS